MKKLRQDRSLYPSNNIAGIRMKVIVLTRSNNGPGLPAINSKVSGMMGIVEGEQMKDTSIISKEID